MATYNIIPPEKLRASVKLPASKSISNRALIIYALSGSDILPQNLSDCDDTEVIIRALEAPVLPEVVDIKAAGTAMRFMTAFLATTVNSRESNLSDSILLTGTERMKHRPIKILVNALRRLGADIEYAGEEGFPPLRIRGQRLDGGWLDIPGDVSSQYISALLMIGPKLRNGLTLHLTGDIISRPYIDLTLWTMREFGADAEWTKADTIEICARPYKARPYLIENDWSAASYWYEMVALSPDPEAEVQLEGLMDGSRQGDSSVRYIFSLLGVKTTFGSRIPGKPTTVTLRKSMNRVTRLEYDFENTPDLAQTIVCTCCALGIPFHFTGLQTLKIKETDRIEALKAELRKLGFVLYDKDDRELCWDGTVENEKIDDSLQRSNLHSSEANCQSPISIDTYDDHRMALAFAPMSMVMPIRINNPQVVTKSYPRYWDDLRRVGFKIEKLNNDI